MEQVGFVKKLIGKDMEIELRRVSACGTSCNSCSGSCEVAPHIITIPNKLNANIGDFVEVKGEVKSMLKYTLIVYMIPFIATILGIVGGYYLFKNIGYSNYEMLGFLVGALFLIISFFIVKIIDKKIENKNESVVSAIRIL